MEYIDRKFVLLASTYLEGWKDLGNDKFNCRCPFCGDSQKNKRKKRGYFFTQDNTVFYKCHNCGTSMNLAGFFKDFSPDLASQYRFEKFASKQTAKLIETHDEKKVNRFITNTAERLKHTSDILSSCVRIFTLDEDHPARVYLNNRKIPVEKQRKLFYVKDASKFVVTIKGYEDTKAPKVGAILIPFYNEVGVLTYCQLRMLTGNLRYITLEISDGKKIWGLSDIDWEKPVYVVEGPFDAMFIENCLAVAGVSILSERKYLGEKCKSGYTLIFDKDYQFNGEVFEQMAKAIDLGETVVLFDKHFSGKDVNEAVEKSGWSERELMEYLKSHAKSGLSAKLALTEFKPPTTRNDKYAKTLPRERKI